MSTHPSTFDHRISRRDLLRGVTIGSGLALLAAATPLNSAAADECVTVARPETRACAADVVTALGLLTRLPVSRAEPQSSAAATGLA